MGFEGDRSCMAASIIRMKGARPTYVRSATVADVCAIVVMLVLATGAVRSALVTDVVRPPIATVAGRPAHTDPHAIIGLRKTTTER